MTCLIIEDQPPAQRLLQRFITDTGTLELRGTYADALLAADHLRRDRVDLLFLDINLPKMSGLDFLKSLPTPPAVIITTAYSEYALEGYELDVIDYLLKPFSFQRFLKAVNKVSGGASYSGPENPVVTGTSAYLFLKSGHEYVRLSVSDLLYLRAGSDYTELVTPTKKHLSPDPLRGWLERLDPRDFTQVHRSYVIHLKRVERVIGNEIFLNGEVTVPIGRAYKEAFLAALNSY